MPKTLYAELFTAFKLKAIPEESFEDFAVRASDRVNKCKDSEWKELSSELQTWTNEVLKTREENLKIKDDSDPATLPELDGFPEPQDESDGDQTDGDEGPEDEETANDNAEESSEEETVDEASEGEQDAESDGETDAEDSSVEDEPEPEARKLVKTTRPDKGAKPNKEKEKPVRKVNSKEPEATQRRAVAKKVATAKARGGGVNEDATIKVLAKKNPHREGTKLYNYFEKYKSGMTVGALLKAKVPPKNIAYLKGLGHIQIVEPKRAAKA